MPPFESPFTQVPRSEWLAANRSAFAIWDAFPVSTGHALVVSHRLIADWWEATPGERTDIFDLVDEVKAILDEQHRPDSYNVGFNAGTAAGQTVDHLHVHVIPRYIGDVTDPRGGVRHVIPAKGNYLTPPNAPTPAALEQIVRGVLPAVPSLDSTAAVLVDGQVRMLEPELIRHLQDERFDHVDIVVSFIRMSGLTLVEKALQDARDRGAAVRILTTDYLGITELAALARLHDLMVDSPSTLEVRVFRDPATSFHPKAYLFWSTAGQGAAAFVGSSNLSGSGLAGGIEWNLLVDGIGSLRERFVELWDDDRSVVLSQAVLDAYKPATSLTTPVIEITDPPAEAPEPRPIQQEALAALAKTRADGFDAGMVVMATGLGKTWLAAFDAARPGIGRVLFIAHRDEILRQSRDVFRKVIPDGSMGLYTGGEKQPDAQYVFASVQTLRGHLDAFAADTFDYIVVDEFHHAAASSYRTVLDHFTPKFLLGLTATPERTDGADLLALCRDNVPFHCDLVDGIARKELVPFHYWGVPDPVDFEPIPWRGGRFDPEVLQAALETQDRALAAFDEWEKRKGMRTLAFCASKHHADFMARFFRERGIRCAAVHTGPLSAPRHQSIDHLRNGALEVLFAVDLFNEGLDVPEIDTVLMLRPTESPIIFLQQLGRGLRTMLGKAALTVIDFIGNHRTFLLKPRTLLSLGTRVVPTTSQVLAALESNEFDLPEGCSVDYDLSVVEMLRELARMSGRDLLEDYCRSYLDEEGLRPTAAQAFRAGHNVGAAAAKHGGWFAFLGAAGLLGQTESATQDAHGLTLRALETESVNKSFKLVALRALLHDGALRSGAPIAANAETSRLLLLGDPRLGRDVPTKEFPDLSAADASAWTTYWRTWPIAHLTGGSGSGRTDALFRIETDRIIPTFDVGADTADAFDAMAAEIIEYRLARYVVAKDDAADRSWTCGLAFGDGRPIVRLDRRQSPDLPEGPARFVAAGVIYEGAFGKGALTTATRDGVPGNALPAVLKGWFGPSAGHAGTAHQIALDRVDGTLVLREAATEGDVEADPLPLFADYTVACGPTAQTAWNDHAATEIRVRRDGAPLSPSTHFACFARGESMDGGPNPIKHGDPLLFSWIAGGSARDFVDQPVLVETSDRRGAAGALKILRRDGASYSLESTNPLVGPITGSSAMRPVAKLVRKLTQADINPLTPLIGDVYKRVDIPPLYGLEFNRGNWATGHVSIPGRAILFVTLEKSGGMTAYQDHFEGHDTFVWSSQNSTGPDGKKGREILHALETGTTIELWARKRKSDVVFAYLGRVVPVRHEGNRPMSVTFRLLTALNGDLRARLAVPHV